MANRNFRDTKMERKNDSYGVIHIPNGLYSADPSAPGEPVRAPATFARPPTPREPAGNNINHVVLLREKSYFRKVRKCYAISEKREGRNVKMSKLCPLRESNSTSILCLPDVAALGKLIWSSFWAVEDRKIRSG